MVIMKKVERMNDSGNAVDVIVRTKNSAETLENCLSAARYNLNVNRLILIDSHSTDGTVEIASKFEAEIYCEDRGLGYATWLGIQKAETENIVFLDSDVVSIDPSFMHRALNLLHMGGTGAVVGQAVGHVFQYGLPLSLALIPLDLARGVQFNMGVMGRETYFIQKHLRRMGRKVRYVDNAIVHSSIHRGNIHWPEWQGAWVRNTSGLNLREVLYSFLVVFLMLTNSRNLKNFFYIPIFQAKILRGFIHPCQWQGSVNSSKDPCKNTGGH